MDNSKIAAERGVNNSSASVKDKVAANKVVAVNRVAVNRAVASKADDRDWLSWNKTSGGPTPTALLLYVAASPSLWQFGY